MADDDENPDLARTTRTAATLAAMISLFATALAPAGDPTSASATLATTGPATTQVVSTEPATSQATMTTTAPATNVTLVVQLPPASQPASRPAVTEQDVIVARDRGNLVAQAIHVLSDTGISETVRRTGWLQWFYALLAGAIGLILGRLVSRGVNRLGSRAAENVELSRAVVLHSFAGPVSLTVVTIGVAVGLTFVELQPAAQLVFLRLFQLLFASIIGWLLYNLVEVISLLLTRVSRGRQGNLSMMLVPIVRRTLRMTIVGFLFLWALNNVLNVQIQTLLAGVGIAGLAVSLAAQDTLKNLFGSVMIFADQPFLIGDYVRVDPYEGTVEDIGFRSTRLRTVDGFLISIPNAKVADAAVTNLSRRKAIRRVVDVGLPYDTTPEQVDRALAILRQIVAAPDVAKELDARRPAPTVALDELRPGGMRVRVVYWFRVNDADAFAQHSERVNRAILDRFASAGLKLGVVG